MTLYSMSDEADLTADNEPFMELLNADDAIEHPGEPLAVGWHPRLPEAHVPCTRR